MADHPKKVLQFIDWSKKMVQQATVPERISHGVASSPHGKRRKSVKGRRKRKRRRRIRKQD